MGKGDITCPAWMMTFGDCMSLLLTFFVMLLSFTKPDQAQLAAYLGAMRGAFDIRPDMLEREQNVALPDGAQEPEMLTLKEISAISSMVPTVKTLFKDFVDDRFENQIFFRMTDEGMAIIIETKPVFKTGSVELLRGNENLFRGIGNFTRTLDNEIRVTAVVPAGMEFDASIARTPWRFAMRRAQVFKNTLSDANSISRDRFGVGAHVLSRAVLAGDGPALKEYVEILIVEKRQIREAEPDEIVIKDKWL